MCVVVLCGWCAGCAHDRLVQRLASWQGSSYDTVVTGWGRPDRCEPNAATRICLWQMRPMAAGVGVTPGSVATCRTMFEFDADGRVIGWRWRGDHCQRLASTVATANAPDQRPDAFAHARWREPEPGVVMTDRSAEQY